MWDVVVVDVVVVVVGLDVGIGIDDDIDSARVPSSSPSVARSIGRVGRDVVGERVAKRESRVRVGDAVV